MLVAGIVRNAQIWIPSASTREVGYLSGCWEKALFLLSRINVTNSRYSTLSVPSPLSLSLSFFCLFLSPSLPATLPSLVPTPSSPSPLLSLGGVTEDASLHVSSLAVNMRLEKTRKPRNKKNDETEEDGGNDLPPDEM